MRKLSDKELADNIKVGLLDEVARYLNSEYEGCKNDAEVCRVSELRIKVLRLISEEQAVALGKLLRAPLITFTDSLL